MPEMIQLGPVSVCVPDDGTMLRYSPDEVDMVRAFFSMLVFGQNEWAGKPFELSAWEEEAVPAFPLRRDSKEKRQERICRGPWTLPPGCGWRAQAPGGHLRRRQDQRRYYLSVCQVHGGEYGPLSTCARPPCLVPGQRAGDPHQGRGPDEGLFLRRRIQARLFLLCHYH